MPQSPHRPVAELSLQGKINKANRKIIAGVCVCTRRYCIHSHSHPPPPHPGVCVLLAAKFYTDVRQKDIKNLVEVSNSIITTRNYINNPFPTATGRAVPPLHEGVNPV